MYIERFFFILFFLISLNLFSKQNKCNLRIIEFTPNHLACMYGHILTKAVKTNFAKVKYIKTHCPECHEPFINALKYSNLYAHPFMALGLSKQPFGGYNLFVIFRGNEKLYKLWFYEINDNDFQLRRISEERIHKALSNDIKKHQFASKYWQ